MQVEMRVKKKREETEKTCWSGGLVSGVIFQSNRSHVTSIMLLAGVANNLMILKHSFIRHIKSQHNPIPLEVHYAMSKLNENDRQNPVTEEQLMRAVDPLALKLSYIIREMGLDENSVRYQFYSYDINQAMNIHTQHFQK